MPGRLGGPLARRPSQPLTFERLEERLLLATAIVNSLADNTNADDFLTLREAIRVMTDKADGTVFGLGRSLTAPERAQVNTTQPVGTNNTIQFADSLAGGELLVTSRLPPIHTHSLLISGATPIDGLYPSITISGGGQRQIFQMTGSNITATFLFLNIVNARSTGDSSSGAAIDVDTTNGRLEVIFSNLSGNVTSGAGADGAAIYSNTSDVYIRNSTVHNNFTTGSGSDGGAIFINDGDLTIVNSTVSGNSIRAGRGGAIASPREGNVTILNSTLSGNHVYQSSGSFGGGAIYSDDGTVTIRSSTITGNSANNRGGGLDMNADGFRPTERLIIQNSIIAGNTAPTNPDFTAPLDTVNDLTVQSSIIGRNNGTSLSATSGNTPDIRGNFIGGSSAATAFNPMLGSLTDNGGATRTHALLPGSVAIDAGTNALATGEQDQRFLPFHRIVNGRIDIGAFESQPLVIRGKVATLTGTNQSETFVFNPQTQLMSIEDDSWLNPYLLPVYIQEVLFEGRGGIDSLTVTGSTGGDTFVLRPSTVLLNYRSDHPGNDFIATGMETIVAIGGGGNDTAFMDDSAGNDRFTANPNSATMLPSVGTAFSLTAQNMFSIVGRAIFGGSDDRAVLLDKAGNDVFGATLLAGNLSGAGYFTSAAGFEVIEARSSGGDDRAFMQDSAGNDSFGLTSGVADLSGTGFFRRARNFNTVSAQAVNGGVDSAVLRDTAGNDTFVSRGNVSFIRGGGLIIEAVGFENVSAQATNGGFDQAFFYDTAGNDTFTATPTAANIRSTGLYREAIGFDSVAAFAVAGGVDTANLFDSTGLDTFSARLGVVNFAGPGFFIQTQGFESVLARANSGGNDRAFFAGGPGNDAFVGRGNDATMTSAGFVNTAALFRSVTISGPEGGTNTFNIAGLNYIFSRQGVWTHV